MTAPKPLVLDTNVLVSALLTPDGNCAHILGLILKGRRQICYDSRIMAEYHGVLTRPKLRLDLSKAMRLLDILLAKGQSVIADESDIAMPDDSDRKFYEVARTCGAWLITGNLQHYPEVPYILTPSEHLQKNHLLQD